MAGKIKPQDPRGKHVRIYVELLSSPAFRVMGFSSHSLFLQLRTKLNGSNNGNISAALSDMKKLGWSSSATLSKALYELRAMGFLAVTVEGGPKQGARVPSLYRFTDLPTFDQPKIGVEAMKETDDYRQYKTDAEAKRRLDTEVARLQKEGKKKQQNKKKSPVQFLHSSSSDSEPEGRISSSDFEQLGSVRVQKMNIATATL
jgi:hypothetical protein